MAKVGRAAPLPSPSEGLNFLVGFDLGGQVRFRRMNQIVTNLFRGDDGLVRIGNLHGTAILTVKLYIPVRWKEAGGSTNKIHLTKSETLEETPLKPPRLHGR